MSKSVNEILFKMFTAVVFVSVIASAFPAMAEFRLDSRYQDNDGDMIADIPSDKSKQADPSTLIFAYTPVEDPAVYAEVWAGFLDHMSELTGKKVQFFPVQSNVSPDRGYACRKTSYSRF